METITTEPIADTKANRSLYMKAYMSARYKANSLRARKQKNTSNCRIKYEICPEIIIKYKGDLHNIVRIKQLMDELDTDILEMFLADDFKTLVVTPKVI